MSYLIEMLDGDKFHVETKDVTTALKIAKNHFLDFEKISSIKKIKDEIRTGGSSGGMFLVDDMIDLSIELMPRNFYNFYRESLGMEGI